MKEFRIVVLAAIAALCFSSCGSLSKITEITEVQYGYHENSTQTLVPRSSAFITPIIADLKIADQKATASLQFVNTLGAIDVQKPAESPILKDMKAKVMSKFLEQTKADVIVAPIYDITTSDDFETVTVSLTGFPANYSKFRSMSESELRLYMTTKE